MLLSRQPDSNDDMNACGVVVDLSILPFGVLFLLFTPILLLIYSWLTFFRKGNQRDEQRRHLYESLGTAV
jgi:hypothetical protein